MTSSDLRKFEQKVCGLSDLNTKLLLLVGGADGSLVSFRLHQFCFNLNVQPINLGLELSRRIASISYKDRTLVVSELLKDITIKLSPKNLVLLENIEILFEPSLQIDPLDTLRKLAHSRRVVAVWPGELRGDRLVYADISHPEHRDYSQDGVVVLEI